MRSTKFEAQFLIRASALLILFLTVWWFALQNPLLFALRSSFQLIGGLTYGGQIVEENAAGQWTFRVPMEVSVPASAETSAAKVHSVIFDIPRPDVTTFTFSLPVLWAILLAAPGIRLRPMLIGTAAMALLETVLLLFFVEISAWKVAGQLSHAQGEMSKWALRFGEYLVVMVIPYAAPLLVALWVHRSFRNRVFGLEPAKN